MSTAFALAGLGGFNAHGAGFPLRQNLLKRTSALAPSYASVTGFGCRPITTLSTRIAGRRSKAAEEGRRGERGARLSGLYGDLVGADGAVWGL